MGIVIITIPGEAKRSFANSLYKATKGQVDLVVIQKQKSNHNSLIQRLKRLYQAVGLWRLPKELFYAMLLRTSVLAKDALEYFRERSAKISESEYLPKILETNSVNGEDIFEIIKKLSPSLLVIWGGTIVKPHILGTAKKAINLHMGLCPYYRGALANQHAVMRCDLEKIGATIHYAEEKVDTGGILETIAADASKSPKELFRELNDQAEEKYLEIATKLFNQENLPSTSQQSLSGNKLMFKDWTPSNRYKLAKKILHWEQSGVLG